MFPELGAVQLGKQGLTVKKEKPVTVIYDELPMECGFRADLLVNGAVVVELKAKSTIYRIDEAQTIGLMTHRHHHTGDC